MITHNGPYKILSSVIKYQNPWILVREDKVIHPSGREGLFGVVECAPGVIVVALNDDGLVYVQYEYKFALKGESLEVPCGGVEPGQSCLEAAKRELKEEAGVEATTWISLGQIEPYTTTITSPMEAFLATDLTSGIAANEDSEVIRGALLPFDEVYEKAMNGKMFFAPAVTAIARAKWYLDNHQGNSTAFLQ